MELRHLRYFCSVAEHRSFTRAARQLNVSQSGVSGQVHDLEQELGVTLLRRNKREVILTPQGAAFWEEAKEILSRAGRAIEIARGASEGKLGRLTVGLCGPATAPFLPAIIRKFRRHFPGVVLALREREPSMQIDALLSEQIDIGFTRGVPSEAEPLLHQSLLFRERMIVALPKRHPLASQSAIVLPALAASRLVLYCREGAPEIFDAALTLCRRARFAPKLADTPCSWPSVITMVEAGEGVALVPACVQHLRSNDVVFRPLQGSGVSLNVIVVWRRSETSFAVDDFLRLLRSGYARYKESSSSIRVTS